MKRPTGMLLGVVQPLAEVCDTGRELLQRLCALKPTVMTERLMQAKFHNCFTPPGTIFYILNFIISLLNYFMVLY